MPVGNNMLFGSDEIAAGASNLARIMGGDPTSRYRNQLLPSEIEQNLAQAESARALANKYGAETTGIGITNKNRQNLGGSLANLHFRPGMTSQDFIDENSDAIGSILGADPNTEQGAAALNKVSQLFLSFGNPNQMRQGAVLGGVIPTDKSAFTSEEAASNATRDALAEQTKGVAVQDAQNAGAYAREVARQKGLGERLMPTLQNQYDIQAMIEGGRNSRWGVNIPRGSTYVPGRLNSLYGQFGGDGAYTGPTIHGDTVTPGGGAVPVVNAPIMNQIKMQMMDGIPGALSAPDAKGQRLPDKHFDEAYPPETWARANAAASAAFQKTKDIVVAAKAMKDALGIGPGADYQPTTGGVLGSMFGDYPGKLNNPNVTPQSPMMNATQTAPNPPPVAQQPPPAPPPTSRVVNQVYMTPKGPLTWTGTGWRQ